jgi:hypothetical protein
MRWRLGRRLGASWRLRRRLDASFRRSELLLGVLNRLVLNRHLGQGRRGFPEARESLADQERACTGMRASHSQCGSRRTGATSKQEDQRGRAGSGSERSEEATPTHHGDSGAGLSCPGGQFAPCNIQLLAGYDRSHLVNSGHGHQPLGYPRRWAVSRGVTLQGGEDLGLRDRSRSQDEQHPAA